MRRNNNSFFLLPVLVLLAAGCTVKSYPADRVKESLQEICSKEYGIHNIDVKFAGKTIGVYLPLEKLFATDFKSSVVAGKVRNLETLFEPSPEALEKVEDVLFSISRVLLSTDREIEVYVLQATDVENTGLQIILKGHVNDVKRVRVWDISRNEYRKRVIHEMRQNRAVLWHAPVRKFFRDLSNLPMEELMEQYFVPAVFQESVQSLFLAPVKGEKSGVAWHVVNMRSARVQRGEVLVYASVKPMKGSQALLAQNMQFLFLVSFKGTEPKILRIIPFQYTDEQGTLQQIPFPADIHIEQSLESWEEEFPLEEIHLGDFLSEQLSRRVQMLIASNERVQNTFQEIKVSIKYEKDTPAPYFSFVFDSVALRDFNPYLPDSMILHEDMLYLLNLISREFLDVLRSYQFGDFEYLTVNISHEPGEHIIGRDDLELFRKKKMDIQGLLSLSSL